LVEDTTVRFADLVPTVMSSDVAGTLEEGSEVSAEEEAYAEADTIGKMLESNRKVIAATIRKRAATIFLNGGLVPAE
jgi:hypothetical protein